MGMNFCRGCAKEIHESAPTCPHCGALQGTVSNTIGAGGSVKPHWTSITALVTGIFDTVMAIGAQSSRWDQDMIVGAFMFGCIPIVFGTISLIKKKPGRWMAITGIVLGSIMLLVALGSS